MTTYNPVSIVIDSLTAAAKAEINFSTNLAKIEHELPVTIGNVTLCSGPLFYYSNIKIVIDASIRKLFRSHGLHAAEILASWIASSAGTHCDGQATFTIKKIESNISYRKDFEENFNHERHAKEFISDEFVPTGTFHYRYLYTFDESKGIYTRDRHLVTKGSEQMWKDSNLWFDYFGPEEDIQGLIPYLDY